MQMLQSTKKATQLNINIPQIYSKLINTLNVPEKQFNFDKGILFLYENKYVVYQFAKHPMRRR